jgi:hypothetical protein
VLAGQKLGIKEDDEGIWLASFMHYDFGYFDLEQKTLQPLDNPFGTRLSPRLRYDPVTYVTGLDMRSEHTSSMGSGRGAQPSPSTPVQSKTPHRFQ